MIHFPHKKFHIELINGDKPVIQWGYKILFWNERVFKRKIMTVLKEGILEKYNQSKWQRIQETVYYQYTLWVILIQASTNIGSKNEPNVAQNIMTNLLQNLDEFPRCIEIYIDNCGIWTNGMFEHQFYVVKKVLAKLCGLGLKCNPLKYDWEV